MITSTGNQLWRGGSSWRSLAGSCWGARGGACEDAVAGRRPWWLHRDDDHRHRWCADRRALRRSAGYPNVMARYGAWCVSGTLSSGACCRVLREPRRAHGGWRRWLRHVCGVYVWHRTERKTAWLCRCPPPSCGNVVRAAAARRAGERPSAGSAGRPAVSLDGWEDLRNSTPPTLLRGASLLSSKGFG